MIIMNLETTISAKDSKGRGNSPQWILFTMLKESNNLRQRPSEGRDEGKREGGERKEEGRREKERQKEREREREREREQKKERKNIFHILLMDLLKECVGGWYSTDIYFINFLHFLPSLPISFFFFRYLLSLLFRNSFSMNKEGKFSAFVELIPK
jgi:hypothetical protein